MEFGLYHEFPSLIGRPDSDAFADAFAIVDAAERWGLDVMWLAELHFDPARSVLSAPLCIASAIAARTSQSKSASRFRCCHSATRCALPRKPRQWIRSAAVG